VVQLAALLSESHHHPRARAAVRRPARGSLPKVCEETGAELSEGAVELGGRTLASWKRSHPLRARPPRGNRRAVSQELGIARSSLLRKLDTLGSP